MTQHVIGQINQLSVGEGAPQISSPAIIMPVKLVGRLEGWHFCAKTGLCRKAFDNANTISIELKAIIRDNMNSPTDFAMDNLFATDGQKYGGGGHAAGDPAGKDGILVDDLTNAYWLTMVTVVHPVTPSGSYFRQWQGVLTNDFGVGSFVIGSSTDISTAVIGVNLDFANNFVYKYASGKPAETTMAANDILTVNWTVTVG